VPGPVGSSGAGAIRGKVVQCSHHLNARHAVDRTVVQFEGHCERALRYPWHGIQSFDDSDLPRRTSQVDLSGVQACDLDTELPPVTGMAQPDMTDVILQIEVRVIYPIRPVQTARQLGQSPPKHICEVQRASSSSRIRLKVTLPPGAVDGS
jgi:hypothetical protein